MGGTEEIDDAEDEIGEVEESSGGGVKLRRSSSDAEDVRSQPGHARELGEAVCKGGRGRLKRLHGTQHRRGGELGWDRLEEELKSASGPDGSEIFPVRP